MTPQQKQMIFQILPELYKSYEWMLTDIKTRADEINEGDYSPELQLAMACKETMDALIDQGK